MAVRWRTWWRMRRAMPWLVRKISHFQPILWRWRTMWVEVTERRSRVTNTLYTINQAEVTPCSE